MGIIRFFLKKVSSADSIPPRKKLKKNNTKKRIVRRSSISERHRKIDVICKMVSSFKLEIINKGKLNNQDFFGCLFFILNPKKLFNKFKEN